MHHVWWCMEYVMAISKVSHTCWSISISIRSNECFNWCLISHRRSLLWKVDSLHNTCLALGKCKHSHGTLSDPLASSCLGFWWGDAPDRKGSLKAGPLKIVFVTDSHHSAHLPPNQERELKQRMPIILFTKMSKTILSKLMKTERMNNLPLHGEMQQFSLFSAAEMFDRG